MHNHVRGKLQEMIFYLPFYVMFGEDQLQHIEFIIS
jgi:hypothetical protein